ncbi:two-component system histidine kinase PnpS [Jeotgalibacillus salarius]|uniref:histidine kinase n=1 Tax=Jeotgalibacillus salarius TaxID=546023 RepID=A0A4Y8LEP5_9BACL|nr:ATP-binding protein [Jeotgalibacillus salarius]TFE01155.1 HAMP domain-containing histidine kinase [Jeotgalibacillus salarius]
MTSFKSRLLFALITLIVLVLIGLGIIIGELVKSYYLNALHSRIEKEMNIVINQTEQEPSFSELRSELFDELSDVLETRIAILTEDSEIVYDSRVAISNIDHDQMMEEINDSLPDPSDGIIRFPADENNYYYISSVETGLENGYVVLAASFDNLEEVYRQIWLILIITLGAAMGMIIYVGARITNQYTKPIESATEVAIQLAKGNYKARTFEDRADETGMLSNAINILARNLQEMVSEQSVQQDRLRTLIENMGSGLIMIDKQGYIVLVNRPFLSFFHSQIEEVLNESYVDIFKNEQVHALAEEVFLTEQRVRRQILIDETFPQKHLEVYGAPIIGERSAWQGIVLVFHDISELKKLEQMRKDFVANVSHEVKTPITSIKGFTETLLDGAMNDKEALESFLHIIAKESDRLQMLIQDLLELSRVEQQGFKLSLRQVDLADILKDVSVMMEHKAGKKNANIQLDIQKPLMIEGDADRLKQVFINLLTNALTYSYPDQDIMIKSEKSTDEVKIKFIDQGIGMEKEELSRIFERFYRVDKARSRNSGGTGLGLAIVKHIIEVHKGDIQVESEPEKGTVFTITLPIKMN